MEMAYLETFKRLPWSNEVRHVSQGHLEQFPCLANPRLETALLAILTSQRHYSMVECRKCRAIYEKLVKAGAQNLILELLPIEERMKRVNPCEVCFCCV